MKSNYPFWSRANIKEFMERNNASPLKKWGQNFLIDPNIVDFIIQNIDAKRLDESNVLCEIGCGLGALTHRLPELNKKLLLFEIDPVYIQYLKNSEIMGKNFSLIEGDFLKTIRGISDLKAYILGNLPYYISSEILTSIFKNVPFFSGGIFMVQKEFGFRIVKEISSLSIFCSMFVKTSILKKISPSCFYPSPDKESILIKMEPISIPQKFSGHEIELMEVVLKSIFWGKRKTIRKSLKDSPFLKIDSGQKVREISGECFLEENIPLDSRPDNIPIEKYQKFFTSFIKKYLG